MLLKNCLDFFCAAISARSWFNYNKEVPVLSFADAALCSSTIAGLLGSDVCYQMFRMKG